MINKKIWLIGTGAMGIEYARILEALGCEYTVIGRGVTNSKLFFEATGIQPHVGGLDIFLRSKPQIPDAVINATGIEALTETTQELLRYGVKYMLLEKPGFGYPEELAATVKLAEENNTTVFIAYNRRFYASVLKAKQLIEADGGCTSFLFEFTEWSHIISGLKKEKAELENWFYGNSTHVIDTAFFLGGTPVEICSYKTGALEWHPKGSVYAGAGYTEKGSLFSYSANWQSAGRWNLEVCTPKRRLIFRPLEKLQCQLIGTIETIFVDGIDYSYDQKYKPGLYKQIIAFLNQERDLLLDISKQNQYLQEFYTKINF